MVSLPSWLQSLRPGGRIRDLPTAPAWMRSLNNPPEPRDDVDAFLSQLAERKRQRDAERQTPIGGPTTTPPAQYQPPEDVWAGYSPLQQRLPPMVQGPLEALGQYWERVGEPTVANIAATPGAAAEVLGAGLRGEPVPRWGEAVERGKEWWRSLPETAPKLQFETPGFNLPLPPTSSGEPVNLTVEPAQREIATGAVAKTVGEFLLDPANALAKGGALAAQRARFGAPAAERLAAEAVPPVRRLAIEEAGFARRRPEGIKIPIEEWDASWKRMDAIDAEIANMEKQAEELAAKREWATGKGIKRPERPSAGDPWEGRLKGYSDEDLIQLAKNAGTDPYMTDWWDSMDSKYYREFVPSQMPSRTQMAKQIATESARNRSQLAALRRERAALDKKLSTALPDENAQAMAPGTSVQTGLEGFGPPGAQGRMLEEFGGAPGTAGQAPGLLDKEALLARERAKPLEGQQTFMPKAGEVTVPGTEGAAAKGAVEPAVAPMVVPKVTPLIGLDPVAEPLINRYVNLLRNPVERRYGASYVAWLKDHAIGIEPSRGRLSLARAEAIKQEINDLHPWGTPAVEPAVGYPTKEDFFRRAKVPYPYRAGQSNQRYVNTEKAWGRSIQEAAQTGTVPPEVLAEAQGAGYYNPEQVLQQAQPIEPTVPAGQARAPQGTKIPIKTLKSNIRMVRARSGVLTDGDSVAKRMEDLANLLDTTKLSIEQEDFLRSHVTQDSLVRLARQMDNDGVLPTTSGTHDWLRTQMEVQSGLVPRRAGLNAPRREQVNQPIPTPSDQVPPPSGRAPQELPPERPIWKPPTLTERLAAAEPVNPWQGRVYRGISDATPVDEGFFGKGMTFSTAPEVAHGYGAVSRGGRGVIEGTVSLEKPYIVDTRTLEGKGTMEANALIKEPNLTERLKSAGYDGVVVKGWHGTGDEVVAFYPEKAFTPAAPEAPRAAAEGAVAPPTEAVPPIPEVGSDWGTLSPQQRAFLQGNGITPEAFDTADESMRQFMASRASEALGATETPAGRATLEGMRAEMAEKPPGGGRVPPEVPPGGEVPPTPPEPPPAQPQGLQPDNVLGLKPFVTGLTRTEELANKAKRLVSKTGLVRPIEEHPLVARVMQERQRLADVVSSLASRLQSQTRTAIRGNFKVDAKGRIQDLAGIDPLIPGAPTLQDVAARYAIYEPRLTEGQRATMEWLRQETTPYRDLLDQLGIEVHTRADVKEGGFYLPRGRADVEGADLPLKLATGRRGTKKGFEKPAVFDSQAAGIEAGYVYAPADEAISAYAQDAGRRAVDQHTTDYFKNLTDETGEALAETPKMRLLRQNPEIATGMESLRSNLNRLRSLLGKYSAKEEEAIIRFLDDPTFDDIDALRTAMEDITVKRGRSAGASVSDLRQALYDVKQDIRAFAPKYKLAMRRAQPTPREAGMIDLPQLTGYSFPDAIANAANKVLLAEGGPRGAGSIILRTANTLNNLYRGLRATLDNSALGIQALLAHYADPKASFGALKVNAKSWLNGGDTVLGAFMKDFDAAEGGAGRLTSQGWGREGLHLGAQRTEYQIGQGFGGRLQNLPGIRQADRAFGNTGDSLRLEWARDMLTDELSKGKTLEQLAASGDLRRIADVANNMTGWARGKTFGSVGDLLLFAPRFLQSRLETVAKAGRGLLPGAALDERVARQSILKMIGWATVATVGINAALGNETDLRPMTLDAEGKWKRNPNFMRIRALGRDWSLFGTWDSLLGLFLTVGTGHPEQALRNYASGVVADAWDLISGRDYSGEPTRDNPENFAKWVLQSMVPFSWGEIPDIAGQLAGGKPEQMAAGLANLGGQIVGARSSPLSTTDKFDEIAKKVTGGKINRWQDLPAQQRLALESSPEVKALLDPGETKIPMNLRKYLEPQDYAKWDAAVNLTRQAYAAYPEIKALGLSLSAVGDSVDKKPLTLEQRTKYQELSWQYLKPALTSLFASVSYQRATRDTQKQMISQAGTTARAKAQSELFGTSSGSLRSAFGGGSSSSFGSRLKSAFR